MSEIFWYTRYIRLKKTHHQYAIGRNLQHLLSSTTAAYVWLGFFCPLLKAPVGNIPVYMIRLKNMYH